MFDRGSKHIQWAKDSLFNKWCWENWTDTCRKMKFDHLLTPYTRTNSQMYQRLKCYIPNHKNPTRKHRQENLGYYL